MTKLISAFPATGKSTLFKTYNGKITDSDSSTFDKKDFPHNYIAHIKEKISEGYEYVLISSHKIVRDALVENELPFILVYPNIELKQEYIERYKNRGNNDSFIKLIETNWDDWINECNEQTGCSKIELQSGQFLSDVI